MFRHPVARWLLVAAYLLVVGVWSSAAAPVALVAAGLAVIVGLVPGPVLVLAAVAAYLRHRPAPPATA